MKQLIPAVVRRTTRVGQRWLQDVQRGDYRRLVQFSPPRIEKGKSLTPTLQLVQAIKATEFAENKIHNVTLATQSLNDVAIEPGELFSFWTLVGPPTARRGYLPGRSLVNNQLQAEYGGGLCQLSGMLHYLALKAGLEIVERHAHSIDLYTDETRFAPLGSDATVVYGYKDFRVLNSLDQPICFQVEVTPEAMTAWLCAATPVTGYRIEFATQVQGGWTEVETWRWLDPDTAPQCLGKSRYTRLT
ncbi:MAG TPA: VanW family protein [Stenomitos sp.]